MKTMRAYKPGLFSGFIGSLFLLAAGICITPHSYGQYFGKNKPGYKTFNYNVLHTDNFEIYYNFKNDTLAGELADLSEYWYGVHAEIFRDTLQFKNPVLFYENHADFQQTNATMGMIDVGTGGFTEGLKNRVVMPVSFTKSQTNHVLGHELVHAFQYNMIAADSALSFRNLSNTPLWMIEGMAEYMSIGSVDPHTSMWIRDAILNKEFPAIDDLNKKPQYNPYRYGQAFWTFVARTWGDTIIHPLFHTTAKLGTKEAFKKVLGMDEKTFSSVWKSASITHFKELMKDSTDQMIGSKLISEKNAGYYNISPAISPNGKYIAFISEKDLFTIDLFLADAENGKVLSKLSSTVRNDEIDAFNFIESSGSWSPDSRKFVYVVYSKGTNKLMIIDAKKRKVSDEITVPGIKAISNPAWSPDGKHIAFTGSVNGQTSLYLYGYYSETLVKLTHDGYSYIHPSWSPDGKYLVFSTDKNYVDGRTGYVAHPFDIARLNLKTGETEVFDIFPGAGNLNPVFSNNGESIFFISDRDGFRNLYRYSISDTKVYRLTDYLTGISGITLLSPAISISKQDELVYSYYKNHKYEIYKANIKDFGETLVNPMELNYAASTLPPLNRAGINIIDSLLQQQPVILRNSEVETKKIAYRPKFKLDYISNTSIGVAAGRLGTGMAGSVSAIFSDITGDNQIFSNLALNGEIYDFGGQVAYINQKKRLKWGASVSHIPYRYGSYFYKQDTIDISGEKFPAVNMVTDIVRLFETQASLFAYYPVSTTRRIESGLSVSGYNYRIDRFNNYYSDLGYYLGQSREKLDAPDGFSLVEADIAYVYDNSFFGITSPMQGARARYQLAATSGTFQFFTTLVDYRKYFFVKPVSFAFRFYNYNRFGKDAESNRFSPLYIGYPFLIRGYDGTTGNKNYVSNFTIDQLTGSRMLVANAEFRLPFTGPERLSMIKSKFLFTDLALFFDGGLIWDSGHAPDFKWQIESQEDRIPLLSAGVSLRVNVFGYIVIEPFYAFPFQNGGFKNPTFGINFLPGW
ncbi:MAG: PD40 domain-containing protein [Bacteroidales bacterium]|nr:PD40 domain-containing protein [Bacteroidales bacterium]